MQGKFPIDHLQGSHLPHVAPFQPNLHNLSLCVWIHVCGAFAFSLFSVFLFLSFFFLFSRISGRQLSLFTHSSSTVHTLFIGPTTTLFRKKILKMDLTALFTHLKIILLQCFQFSISAKISCIQTDP